MPHGLFGVKTVDVEKVDRAIGDFRSSLVERTAT
jgi:hypothetical protein